MKYDIRIDQYGTKRYYENNRLSRDDGPAIELTNGDKLWYKNGVPHREGGPAILKSSIGAMGWFKEGVYHRDDGPAIEYSNEKKEWWINGKLYGINNDFTNKSWIAFIKTLIFS